MIKLHIEGGINYMAPLSLLFLINLALIIIAGISWMRNKAIGPVLLESIRQIGGLALVWGILSTIIGFYQAFDDLSKMSEALPLNVIMGGLRVALITAAYGMIIFSVSLAAHLGLRLVTRNSST